MKSILSYRAYVFTGLTLPSIMLLIYLFNNRIEAFGKDYNLKFIFVGSLLLITCFWLILGTYRRVISLTINDKEVIVKNIFNSVTKIKIDEIDGFESTIETSRGGSYEVIYLIKNKKTLVHISEFHLANYSEIKKEIKSKISDLGIVDFLFITDWKRY